MPNAHIMLCLLCIGFVDATETLRDRLPPKVAKAHAVSMLSTTGHAAAVNPR